MENNASQDCDCGCQVIGLSAHRQDPWACDEDDPACCDHQWEAESDSNTDEDCCCC